MIVLGADVGSLFTKIALFDDDDLVATRMIRTTGNIGDLLDALFSQIATDAGFDRSQIEVLAATGSGGDLVPGASFIEDAPNCVGAAASFYMPDVRFAVNIGGQSITSMSFDEDGLITNLMNNDKCASGSGRFLEVMSDKLEMPLDDLDPISKQATAPVLLSSQCGVFAESEVITHVNEGQPVPDIVAGIGAAVANIVVAQARRFGVAGKYTLVGGVARFDSVACVISQKTNGTYKPFPFDPQYATAIGAALLAGS
jgi:predicted CoA-substrate-specific enzyme activase